MKLLKTILLLLLSFTGLSQTDTVHLIKPIVESPVMSPNVAKVFRRSEEMMKTFRNWGIEKTRLDSIMKGYTGKDICVCIVDTGRPDHPDLSGNIAASANFTIEETDNDGNGHATHVAGIVLEIAPEAKLYFAKVLNIEGSGSNTGVANGIRWCRQQKAHEINLSLGSPTPSTIIKKQLDSARIEGILIVAAAGNDGGHETQEMIGYPARYPESIAVGSVNDELAVSWFSSSGINGDIVAPGERILSTWLDGNYILLSGTSMATPFISGVIALHLDKYGNIDSLEHTLNRNTTDILPDGFDRYSFWGITNPEKLFKPVVEIPEPIDTIPKDSVIIEPEPPGGGKGLPKYFWWIVGGVVLVIAAGLMVYFIRKNKAQ